MDVNLSLACYISDNAVHQLCFSKDGTLYQSCMLVYCSINFSSQLVYYLNFSSQLCLYACSSSP